MQDVPVDDAVRTVVARQLDIRPGDLTRDASLEDLGMDDDKALSVLEAVEDVLDVRFPDDFFDGVHTYGQLAQAVRVAVGV